MHAATVTIARNRPTRTADYGLAPAGHAKHGRKVGIGKARRPARWTRQLRSGSTFVVDAAELQALRGWLQANPTAARDVAIRELPQPAAEDASAAEDAEEPEPEPDPEDQAGARSALVELMKTERHRTHAGLGAQVLAELEED